MSSFTLKDCGIKLPRRGKRQLTPTEFNAAVATTAMGIYCFGLSYFRQVANTGRLRQPFTLFSRTQYTQHAEPPALAGIEAKNSSDLKRIAQFKFNFSRSSAQMDRKIKVPTIKDIAKKAGVSIATVSRAINREEGLTPETRERVLAIACQLKYYPNLQARGLAARKPEAVGIVIPQSSKFALSNPFYSEVLKGIGAKIDEERQYLVLSFLQRENYAQMYYSNLAAGLIVLANRINDPGIEDARKNQVPLVLIPGDPLKMDVASVDVDHYDGVRQAVNHLIQLGHREIGFMRGPMNSKYTIERLAAFRRVLKWHTLSYRKEWVIEYDFTPEGAYAGVKKLFSNRKLPTGLLLMNDFSAMGVVRAVEEIGCAVPDDISIIGFGDVPLAALTNPSLTTVREPFQEIGYQAADKLLKIIRGKRVGSKPIVLPVELIVRESTAPPPYRKKRST